MKKIISDSLFCEIVDTGDVRLVVRCLALGAYVDADNGYALRRASQDGDIELIKALLMHGADTMVLNEADIYHLEETEIRDIKDLIKKYSGGVINIV